MAQLSFVAGLALHDAAVALQDGDTSNKFTLKWPNDLLCGGMKLGGVLLESKISQQASTIVAMGFGLNLTSHPDVTSYGATDLAQQGMSATPERALECLARACDDRLGIWDNGDGFAEIRAAWMARSLPASVPLQVKVASEVYSGAFGGLAEDGALILILDDGTKKRITTGDVFPL